jgi:hypothetical protein
MQWSEDEQTLYYKDLELHIGSFRKFVRHQVQKCQGLLEELLMIHCDESRHSVVPSIPLYQVRDNPASTVSGWNFLQDERNRDIFAVRKSWLLHRVLDHEWLRNELLDVNNTTQRVRWRPSAVRQYRQRVEAFLESLLLLVHLTAGQPARGTEIISIRHTNTSFHRKIFIEDGLVAIVTSYHKGYVCTGSTKIIHRYLPKEVSEMLIYYLWLVHPFEQELKLLVPCRQTTGNPFLWPGEKDSWSSQRLSNVMKQETAAFLGAPIGLQIYRHLAIALSRRHLKGGGFKRDFDTDLSARDNQSTHTPWTAGRLYARGMEEAPGHVEARRSEFRAVSREWHNFLGFTTSLGARKRPLGETADRTIYPAAR